MGFGLQAGQMFTLQVGDQPTDRPLGVHLKRSVTLKELQRLKAQALDEVISKGHTVASSELVQRELVAILVGRNYAYVQTLNNYVI